LARLPIRSQMPSREPWSKQLMYMLSLKFCSSPSRCMYSSLSSRRTLGGGVMARAYVGETTVALSRKHEVERYEHECHRTDDMDELSPGRLFQLGIPHQHVAQVQPVERGNERYDDQQPHDLSFVCCLPRRPTVRIKILSPR